MLHRLQRVLSIFLNIVLSVYMVLILAVMPFYFTNGYGQIGTDKYEFFYEVTTYAGIVVLPLMVSYLGIKVAASFRAPQLRREDRFRFLLGRISVTDVFALLYGGALLLSWLHSEYRAAGNYGSAWTGARGWNMGLSTQLLFLGIYFCVSRFWRPNKWLPALWIPVTFAVYFLGYCNRFGIYPIEMKYAGRDFISTVGNINWYCGYMVTVFFGILYYWWRKTEDRGWVKAMLYAYCVMGFAALITQGSTSGLLTLIVMCLVFFVNSADAGEKMQRFWLIAICLGCATAITYALRRVFPNRFNFPDTLVELITNTPAACLIPVIALCSYGCVKYWNVRNIYPMVFMTRVSKSLCTLLIGLTGVLVLAIMVNTLFPGSLGGLSEIPIFTFDEKWGSSRGATWRAGFGCWKDQPFMGKLLGVGPDCMANYLYGGSSPDVLAMVQRQFEGRILTNAHCEWLTVLVNTGVVGAITFGGMMITAIRRFLKCGKNNILAGACGMGLLAYTINNVVSFQQAMATTTMFLILGMGETFLRWQEDNHDK